MKAKFTDQDKRDLFRAADTLRGEIDTYWERIGRKRLTVLTGSWQPQASTDDLAVAYRELGRSMPAVGRAFSRARRADVERLQTCLETARKIFQNELDKSVICS